MTQPKQNHLLKMYLSEKRQSIAKYWEDWARKQQDWQQPRLHAAPQTQDDITALAWGGGAGSGRSRGCGERAGRGILISITVQNLEETLPSIATKGHQRKNPQV